MLIIPREDSECIIIEPAAYLDPGLSLEEALRDWQIEIVILGRKQNQTKIGIRAPRAISVLRKELQQNTGTDEAHRDLRKPSGLLGLRANGSARSLTRAEEPY